MRNVIICVLSTLSFVLGAMYATGLQNAPQLTVAGVAWCYVGHFPSLKAVPPLEDSLVDVTSKGVRVFERCNSL